MDWERHENIAAMEEEDYEASLYPYTSEWTSSQARSKHSNHRELTKYLNTTHTHPIRQVSQAPSTIRCSKSPYLSLFKIRQISPNAITATSV